MTRSLEGRTAFVTGGGSGIGRATALAFAVEGARVLVTDLKGADAVATEIVEAGGTAESAVLDVTDETAVATAIDGLVEAWGRIDIAFNNAGVSLETLTTPWDTVDLYDRVVAVNQRGVMLCMAAELRHMARQQSGSIINTASIAGLTGLAGAGYCDSKHAVVGLTRSAALRYAADGVRVNCVCPGGILTPMIEAEMSGPEARDFFDRMHPMNRMGRPEEIAAGVLFLASDKASFITGHPLAIDGDYIAR